MEVKVILDTPSPTTNPTTNPTPNPTSSPTNNPTTNPTSSPTTNPTPSPTSTPTNNPTTPIEEPEQQTNYNLVHIIIFAGVICKRVACTLYLRAITDATWRF